MGIGVAIVHPISIEPVAKFIGSPRFQVEDEEPIALAVAPKRVGVLIPPIEITHQIDAVCLQNWGQRKRHLHHRTAIDFLKRLMYHRQAVVVERERQSTNLIRMGLTRLRESFGQALQAGDGVSPQMEAQCSPVVVKQRLSIAQRLCQDEQSECN